jgi:S-(hydroxymethyl)glutathione dehydrogenase/alcohol dehydrogenase
MVSEPIRMRAAVLRRMGEPMSVVDVLLDPPGPGEVRVRVAAAGVCHSDLHLADGHLGSQRVPIVLGHEGAGVVEAVGPDVASHAPGDRVAFCFVPACGACRQCVAGRRNLCEPAGAHAWRGTMPDGTTRLRTAEGEPLLHFNFVSCFAESCVVPVASAVPLPAGVPLWTAALVGCGVVTAFGAVQDVARVRPGDSVCVIGCGGVGLHVITAARIAGADTIVAVDRGGAKLERARGFGATHSVDATAENVVETVRGLSDGGVDHAFEVVGRADTIRQAWDVLRAGATAVIVGLAPRGVEITLPGSDLLSEKGLRGTYYGSGDPAARIRSLAELAAADGLPIGEAVSDVTDLSGIDAAFDRLREGVGARTIVLLDPELAGYPA